MRTLCCNKDYSSRAVNCFSAPLRVFFLLHNGKMEQEESGAKSHLLPKHCTPDGVFTWKMVHFQEPHGHRLWFQHAGTVLAMGLYAHISAAGAQEARCGGVGRTMGSTGAGKQMKKVSAEGM